MVTSRPELNRRSAIRFANWIRRGFTIQEAAALEGRGFNIRSSTGLARTFLRALVQRRRVTIERLKELNFTERDIFNYLTEQVEARFTGTEELLEQFTEEAGFGSTAERREFITEEARRPTELIFNIATSTDWSRDVEQRLNFIQWVRLRRVTGNELSSRFPNFREP